MFKKPDSRVVKWKSTSIWRKNSQAELETKPSSGTPESYNLWYASEEGTRTRPEYLLTQNVGTTPGKKLSEKTQKLRNRCIVGGGGVDNHGASARS